MFLRLEVIGNLGGDPEMRYTPSGDAVTTFNVASNKVWTGKDGVKHEKATWVRVSAWRALGENCAKFLHKGDQVFVEGEAEARGWIDKSSGEVKAMLELNASNVRFLRTQNNGAGNGEQSPVVQTSLPAHNDDVPF